MRAQRYIPLFWRLFLPNAAVLTAACVILMVRPANGRVLVLVGGLAVMLAVNVALMRRASGPLTRLADLMRDVDPLRPGQRIPPIGPESEVTRVTRAFNDMLDRVETERRQSARREVAAQEAERRHVAFELHDQTGQTLTAVVLHLNRVIERTPPDLRPELEEVRAACSAAIEDVRRLAARLRPEVLDSLGLGAAVTNLCERFGARAGLRVETRISPGLPVLSADAQLVVFRVAQESLTNVARHAGAGAAVVTLAPDNGEVVLTVEDDGAGIRPDAPQGGGLRGMRERALLVGAVLEVSNGGNGGTRVRLVVPADEAAA